MTQVGVYAAKANMSQLIERALAGEKRRNAIAALADFSKRMQRCGRPVSAKDLKAAMEEGRK